MARGGSGGIYGWHLSSHALTLERRSAIEVPLWTSSTLYVVCLSLARSEFASRRKKRVSLMRRCHFSGIRTCLAEGPYCAAVGTRPWSIRLPSLCCSETTEPSSMRIGGTVWFAASPESGSR